MFDPRSPRSQQKKKKIWTLFGWVGWLLEAEQSGHRRTGPQFSAAAWTGKRHGNRSRNHSWDRAENLDMCHSRNLQSCVLWIRYMIPRNLTKLFWKWHIIPTNYIGLAAAVKFLIRACSLQELQFIFCTSGCHASLTSFQTAQEHANPKHQDLMRSALVTAGTTAFSQEQQQVKLTYVLSDWHYTEHRVTGLLCAIFGIIYAPLTWRLCHGLHKQLAAWLQPQKMETNQSPDTDNVLG